MRIVYKYITVLTLIGFSLQIKAQSFDKKEVVNRLADLMNRNYVFPEKGKAMHDLIKQNLEAGKYDEIKDAETFANQLDDDLKSVVKDKHIRVQFDPERVEKIRSGSRTGGRDVPENYGFEKVEINDGIGYLDLRGFHEIRFAEDIAKPAMEKLIKSDAIIFDLRQNGGGSPSMIRFICSYLFQERTHLNSFYWRPSDRYSESWTNPQWAGTRNEDIPVYILTSNYTFSAAEEFTYDLKNLNRAIVIGETTGGGAHPGGPRIIKDGFLVNIPQGRAINPITQTNWEGVGVEPDIKLPADQALAKALDLIRKNSLSKN